MKKLLPLLIVLVLVLSGLGVNAIDEDDADEITLIESVTFTEPYLQEQDQYVTIHLNEADSYLTETGSPMLPAYVKVFTFPLGTKIKDVTCTFPNEQERILSKDIMPAPEPMPVSPPTAKHEAEKRVKNKEIYSSENAYPKSRFRYQTGAGLDNNDHVMFLTVHYYPITYLPQKHTIYYTPQIQIKVTYEPAQAPFTFADEYDLVVIAPSEFLEELQPLVDHKNSYGLMTTLNTTEDIYASYPGRDEAEQIKYFIKDAIETLGVSYVLLIGGVYKLPIRTSHVRLWYGGETVITDLYYADIYDENGDFCSWDSNNNNKFGETGKDQVDLYPDVLIGRLACDTIDEVHVVVDKIIHYEDETYGQEWFHNMIFIGGNTFRGWNGNEGEEINKIIMEIMSDFEPFMIWTSKGNFNPLVINNRINRGAGFLDYSGHGFEHGMGTYAPFGLRLKSYLTPYIKYLKNDYKLPIIFFDACLTARLDFIFQDLLDYKGYWMFNILAQILNVDTSVKLPCFAWHFVKHEGGGAIATIGATRVAFGGIEDGAGKMAIEFFTAYDSSEMLGQMMMKAQNAYINDVVPADAFTVEEFILLGDPSLRIGGYP